MDRFLNRLKRWMDHFSLTWLDLNPRASLRTGNRPNTGDRGFLVLQSLTGYAASSQVPQRSKNFHPYIRIIEYFAIEVYNHRRKKKKRIIPLFIRDEFSIISNVFESVASYLHLVNAKIPRESRIARNAGQRTRFRGKPFE